MKRVTALAVFLLIFSGCNRENTLEEVQIEDVVAVDGALHFASLSAFNTVIKKLNEGYEEDNDLTIWEESLGFENSYRKHQLKGEDYLDVYDPVFATILNAEGVYYVGNQIHIVTPKVEYTVKDGDERKLRAIQLGNVKDLANVEEFEIVSDIRSIQPNARFTGKSTRKITPYSYAPHLSAHLVAWNRTYVLYASVGVRIKGRKNDGGWRDDKMWYARVDYTAKVRNSAIGGSYQLENGGKSGTNTKSVSKTIKWGSLAQFEVEFIDARFKYEDDGNPRVTMYERWD